MHSIVSNWRHLNWAGIGFVFLMLVVLPFSAWLTEYLGRDRRRNPRRTEAQELEAAAIDSTTFTPPHHTHTIDLDRSRIIVTEEGQVIGQCCYQGCTETTIIGRNVAAAIVEVPKR